MRRVIIGPPGTGKTATAIGIVNDRLKLGPNIGYFAFTKRASGEAKDRIDFQITHNSTLHSLCFNQLALKRERVFDIDGFAQYAGLDCTKKKYDPEENEFYIGATEDDQLVFHIGFVKAKGKDKSSIAVKRVRVVWEQMERYKKMRGLSDFHDMLVGFAKDGPFPKLHTIILDEAQDLTFSQRQAFNALCEHNPDALIVEVLDPDQAIFGWAGSEVNLKDLENAEVLKQSYRVPAAIHKLAMKIIRRCKIRKPVEWLPAPHEGKVELMMKMDDVPKEYLSNVLILTRNFCYAKSYMRWLFYNKLEYSSINRSKGHTIRVGSIHEAKGAEADNVILDLNMTRKSWDSLYSDEENRVWYTAVTRAKKNLFLMNPHARCNALNLMG